MTLFNARVLLYTRRILCALNEAKQVRLKQRLLTHYELKPQQGAEDDVLERICCCREAVEAVVLCKRRETREPPALSSHNQRPYVCKYIQMMLDRSDPHYFGGSVALMDCGAGGAGEFKVVILRRRSRLQLFEVLGKAYMLPPISKHE